MRPECDLLVKIKKKKSIRLYVCVIIILNVYLRNV